MRRAQHFGQPVDRSELAFATTNLARRTRSSRRRLNEFTELGNQVRYRRLGIEHQCPVHPANAEQAIGRIQVCELPMADLPRHTISDPELKAQFTHGQ